MSNNSIRVANITTGFVDVPGQISLNIYMQGCKKNCLGCHNPNLQSFNGGKEININIMKDILKGHSMPTWICWLGGDAVYQEEGFTFFNKFFKTIGYKICLYTGMYFDEVCLMLDDVDLVIDGPWNGIPITDSVTNQNVYLKQHNVWNHIRFSDLKQLLKETKNVDSPII